MPLFSSSLARKAALPHGYCIYAVGDIHGRLDLLDRMLDNIDKDLFIRQPGKYAIVFLGDYIDRGPDGASVIERLIEVQQQYPVVCLKGNHETMLLDFVADPSSLAGWSRFGGLTTLLSYGLRPSFKCADDDCYQLAKAFGSLLPPAHAAFIKSAPNLFEFGDFVFVHAGLRPRRTIEDQVEDDLLWIRDDFLEYDGAFPKIVIHGHTPVAAPDFRKNRINIDTGAYATGCLTCLVLEGSEASLLSTNE